MRPLIAHLLLDMSGSMEPRKRETISACNEYVQTLKLLSQKREIKFSLHVFNVDKGVVTLVDNKKPDDILTIGENNYIPDGGTPLYDSMNIVIEKAKGQYEALQKLPQKRVIRPEEEVTSPSAESSVLIITITDGEENSSRTYTKEQIKKQVDILTKQGYQFVFLGCDLDAMAEGFKVGIVRDNTLRYKDAQTMSNSLSSATAMYAMSGAPTSSYFSDASLVKGAEILARLKTEKRNRGKKITPTSNPMER